MEGIGCGGVIIGANWGLTSAECCDGATMKDLFTAANDWDYNTYYDTETIHIPDRKIIHPGSVLKFSKPFAVRSDRPGLGRESRDQLSISKPK